MNTNKKFALIFDMDGVIVDNFEYHREAWHEFTKKYALGFSKQDLKDKAFGRTNDELMPFFFGRDLSKQEIDELSGEKERLYREIYTHHIKPVNGLRNLLQEMQQYEVPLAVATSAPRENADFVVDKVQIRSFFDVIMDASHVTKGKPDPEIYLKTAQKLNFPPEKCIVMEDSLAGIESAQRAGMKVVAVLTTQPAERVKHADYQIKDFSEINYQQLLELL